MQTLQEQLDDPSAAPCGRCAACTAPRFAAPPDARLVELAGRHLRSRPIEIAVKKMAPDATGAMRRIPGDALLEPGWALARVDDGGWWTAIARGLESGAFNAEVADALAGLVRDRVPDAAWVTRVPSATRGPALAALGEGLEVPFVELLERTGDRPPQREMANATAQAANVRGAFRVVGPPPPGTGVLLDDRRSSGWTLAMAGGQLRRAGARRIVPVALATL